MHISNNISRYHVFIKYRDEWCWCQFVTENYIDR